MQSIVDFIFFAEHTNCICIGADNMSEKIVDEMNKKLVALLKEAPEDEVVAILKSEKSLLTSAHVNHINNLSRNAEE